MAPDLEGVRTPLIVALVWLITLASCVLFWVLVALGVWLVTS